MIYDTVIIGGGPAGLAAACFCNGSVCVLERLPAPARKLLATGGGRCNLTHDTDARGAMAAFGKNARFMAPALAGFPPTAIRAFFDCLGVPTAAGEDGCVFPLSQKASDVAAALVRAAEANGAELRCGVRAAQLLTEPLADGRARVVGVATDGAVVRARRVILAAGGQSYPALGADGSGFHLARDAGLAVTAPVPALAGLMTHETWPGALAGIVMPCGAVWLDGAKRRDAVEGPVLFTHKGISGLPALDLSGEIAARLHAAGGGEVGVRLSVMAERQVVDWLALFARWRQQHGGRQLHNLMSGEMPRALATTLCELAGATETTAAHAGKHVLQALAAACSETRLSVTGTEGWSRAMITRGGVALHELESKTLASRKVAGLHCAGEVVDLDGRCGGFNLTWAFASGRLAALSGSPS